MALSDATIKNAKPREKPYKLADERGMYLEVAPSGGKWWRLKYRFDGKEKLISLGVYPDVGLKKARARRDEARKLLAAGADPSAARKAEKAAKAAAGANSFEAVAREWFEKFSPTWADPDTVIRRLELHAFPWIGARPVREVTPPELLSVLRRIEALGVLETAHRTAQLCGQVFRYAVRTGRAERDPSADLKGALSPVRKKHLASITDPKAIGGLLRAIDSYQGSLITRCALKLAPLTFVRPGELRKAEWGEVNLEAGEWRIPAGRMKARALHIVPLSTQAVEVLKQLHPLTGRGRYLFPSARTDSRPMSDNAILAALRRMGFEKEEMTGHGFRSMASTILNEQGWHKDAIERQLAHAERNPVRAAYNYAEYLPERRKMMQAWADYLDGLKQGGEVIPFRKSKKARRKAEKINTFTR
ncbi:MAG: integrase arm-type DNA-binding domain-containing protein [bacterium]